MKRFRIDGSGGTGWDEPALRECLERLRAGTLTWKDVRVAAGRLHARLGSRDPKDAELVTITAPPRLLADVPWEMAGIRRPFDFENTLASYPVVRVVDGHRPSPMPRSRPRVFSCIARPVDDGVPPIMAHFDAAVPEILARHPLLDVVQPSLSPRVVDEAYLVEQLRYWRPHVFVLVAHGRSGRSSGGEPSLLIGPAWTPVRSLAETLRKTDSVNLAVLVCCDQTEAATESGALTLVEHGVGEVVAFQGKMNQDVAGKFMRHFLEAMLLHHSVAIAAGRAREAVRQSPHCYMPSVFASSLDLDEARAGRPFAKILGEYERMLLQLAADCPPQDPHYLPRPALENELREKLLGTGLLGLSGGPGSGRTQLLVKVLREPGRPPGRPTLYVNCAPEIASGPVRELVLSRIIRTVQKYSRAVPEEVMPPSPLVTPLDAADFIRRCKITLILDDLHLDRDADFWPEFFPLAAASTQSLVVVAGNRGTAIPRAVDFPIPPLEKPEVRSYVAQAGLAAGRIFEQTGGVPLLLDSFRRTGKRAAPKAKRMIAFVRSVREALTEREREAACNLSWMPRMAPMKLAAFHFGSKSTLRRLVQAGLLRVERRQGFIPAKVGRAIRSEYGAVVSKSAERARERFVRWLGTRAQERIEKLAVRDGGLSVLHAIARMCLHLGRFDEAASIVDLADTPGASQVLLLEMYRELAGYGRRIGAPTRLRAAELGRIAGDRDLARGLVRSLDRAKLEPLDRAHLLQVKADFLSEEAALPELYDACREGLRLSRAAPDQQADLLYCRLKARLFLEEAPWSEVRDDFERLKELTKGTGAFAASLCTIAEYEMRRPDPHWERIRGLLEQADPLVEKAEPDLRAYCRYQFGQYYRKRPRPDLPTAEKFYAQSVANGDLRRASLAKLRLHQIRRGPEAAGEIESAIRALEPVARDVFALRVLERLYSFRAELAKDPGPWLLGACRNAAHPILDKPVDVRRCVEAFRRYLEHLAGQPVAIEEFLREQREALRTKLRGVSLRAAE